MPCQVACKTTTMAASEQARTFGPFRHRELGRMLSKPFVHFGGHVDKGLVNAGALCRGIPCTRERQRVRQRRRPPADRAPWAATDGPTRRKCSRSTAKILALWVSRRRTCRSIASTAMRSPNGPCQLVVAAHLAPVRIQADFVGLAVGVLVVPCFTFALGVGGDVDHANVGAHGGGVLDGAEPAQHGRPADLLRRGKEPPRARRGARYMLAYLLTPAARAA